MFLRIEGFQVEVKEVNKSWNELILLKNFPIGRYFCNPLLNSIPFPIYFR